MQQQRKKSSIWRTLERSIDWSNDGVCGVAVLFMVLFYIITIHEEEKHLTEEKKNKCKIKKIKTKPTTTTFKREQQNRSRKKTYLK